MAKAILFDIDGTLIRAAAAGSGAMIRSLALEFGVARHQAETIIEGIDFRGATDQHIFEAALRGAKLPIGPTWEPFLSCYFHHLDAALKQVPVEVLPGVHALVERLQIEKNLCIGVLTGNFRPAARLKLEHVGLGSLLAGPGGFGDDGKRRSDIVGVALERLKGRGISVKRCVIIGDTQHDALAAQTHGAKCVLVETGWTDRDVLLHANPDLLLADLTQTKPLTELIDRL
jgi:phosphoglycolate phosphatase